VEGRMEKGKRREEKELEERTTPRATPIAAAVVERRRERGEEREEGTIPLVSPVSAVVVAVLHLGMLVIAVENTLAALPASAAF
jgi:hypothetical protein